MAKKTLAKIRELIIEDLRKNGPDSDEWIEARVMGVSWIGTDSYHEVLLELESEGIVVLRDDGAKSLADDAEARFDMYEFVGEMP